MKSVHYILLLLCFLAGPLAADEKRVHIDYIEPKLEMRLSAFIQRGGLPLALLRVGVAQVHGRLYAQLHFKALNAPREVVQREAATLARRAFQLYPQLEQVDLLGVDRMEFKKPLGKPLVFFSASVRRNRFLALPKVWSPGQLVNSVGAAYYSESCLVGTAPSERLHDAVTLAWRRTRPVVVAGKNERVFPLRTRKPASR